VKLNKDKINMATLSWSKLIMAKLSWAKIFMAKLNHGLNMYCKFSNFIWQIDLFYFILFGIFFRKCKFD
jgi:hypothetical protein